MHEYVYRVNVGDGFGDFARAMAESQYDDW